MPYNGPFREKTCPTKIETDAGLPRRTVCVKPSVKTKNYSLLQDGALESLTHVCKSLQSKRVSQYPISKGSATSLSTSIFVTASICCYGNTAQFVVHRRCRKSNGNGRRFNRPEGAASQPGMASASAISQFLEATSRGIVMATSLLKNKTVISFHYLSRTG